MNIITWDDFEKVRLCVGTVLAVEAFPEARVPAFKVTADFGPGVGVLRTSAQVTDLYDPDDLVGRQVVGVVNFEPKQIGPMMSRFLLTGFRREDGAVVLAVPERQVPNGSALS